jgi:thiamine pyridinylase
VEKKIHTIGRLIFIGLFLYFQASQAAIDGELEGYQASGPLTFRVALFPYIPDANTDLYESMKRKISSEFIKQQAEKGRQVTLDLRPMDPTSREPGDDFYNLATLKGFLQGPDPYDLIEVDGVMLGKIKSLIEPWTAIESADKEDWHPVGLDAAMDEGAVIGVPHWLCGYFLFGRKERPEAKEGFHRVTSIEELIKHFHVHAPQLPFGIDVCGRWNTLGLYLDSYATHHHTHDPHSPRKGPEVWDEALRALQTEQFDWHSISSLSALVQASRVGPKIPALDNTYHAFKPLLTQLFVTGMISGMVGYSERAHHILMHGRLTNLTDKDVLCRRLPPHRKKDIVEEGGSSLVFVDLFVQRKGLEARKQEVSRDFVKFMNSLDMMKYIALSKDVEKEEERIPRYLIPATRSASNEFRHQFPIYNSFLEGIEKGVAFPTSADVYDRVQQGVSSHIRKTFY